MTNSTKLSTVLTSVGLLAVCAAASASVYPGNLVTFTNGAGNTQDLFSFTNADTTISVTGDVAGNNYYLNNVELVGFRSIYVVNPDGPSPAAVSTTAGGGKVTNSLTHSVFTYPVQSVGAYPGYDDGNSGKGYPDGSNWLVVANPSLAGKGSSNRDTTGSFSFSAPVNNFDIGLDYMLAGGQTGRAYFQAPASIEGGPHATPAPEPGALASFAGGTALLGLLLLRARKTSSGKI